MDNYLNHSYGVYGLVGSNNCQGIETFKSILTKYHFDSAFEIFEK